MFDISSTNLSFPLSSSGSFKCANHASFSSDSFVKESALTGESNNLSLMDHTACESQGSFEPVLIERTTRRPIFIQS